MIKKKRTIGITDFIDIPAANIEHLPCKVDTGADNCAIHCERARIKEINGEEHLVFKLLDRRHPLYSGKEIMIKNFREIRIKSSFGDYEIRYQVKLTFKLFNEEFTAPFNLSNRKSMKYPVLLGRKFLSKKFIVDVSKRNLSDKT
ncbi:hypothetical protein GYB22_11210 [bacterium]|nr:hypothetical protein [bacterium]